MCRCLISNQKKDKNLLFPLGNHGSSDSCFFAAPSLSQNWRPSTLATTPARPATRLPDTRNPPPSLSTVRIIIWLMLLLRWWLQHDGRASAARSWSCGFAVPPDWLLFLFLNYVSWNRSLIEVQHYWFSNNECLVVLLGVKQSYYTHDIACCIGSLKIFAWAYGKPGIIWFSFIISPKRNTRRLSYCTSPQSFLNMLHVGKNDI